MNTDLQQKQQERRTLYNNLIKVSLVFSLLHKYLREKLFLKSAINFSISVAPVASRVVVGSKPVALLLRFCCTCCNLHSSRLSDVCYKRGGIKMDLIQAFKEKHSDSVADDNQRQETIDSIRKGEKKLHVSQKELSDMNIDQLHQYLNDLRSRYKSERKDKEKADSADKTSQASADETQQQDQTDSNEPVIPDEIRDILTSVADYYSVEAEAIYKKYLDVKEKLDQPYPLDKFKRTLEGAKDRLTFETGGFIRPLKLDYTDKLTHNRITVYRLTADNSKDDIIKEAHKAEAVCYELGDKHILTKRAKSTGEARLDKVKSKEKLLEYLLAVFDRSLSVIRQH